MSCPNERCRELHRAVHAEDFVGTANLAQAPDNTETGTARRLKEQAILSAITKIGEQMKGRARVVTELRPAATAEGPSTIVVYVCPHSEHHK